MGQCFSFCFSFLILFIYLFIFGQELVLECPALEELNVNECQNLLSVKMSCPNLKKIYGQDCPAMQSVIPSKRFQYNR